MTTGISEIMNRLNTEESLREIYESMMAGMSITTRKRMLTKWLRQEREQFSIYYEVYTDNKIFNRWYLGEQVTKKMLYNAKLATEVVLKMRTELN